jgi:hypothetical protein
VQRNRLNLQSLTKPQIPRRCGTDPANRRPNVSPGNCTYDAKQPFYWSQQEGNNVGSTLMLRLRASTAYAWDDRCSKGIILLHFTWTCITSRMARRMTSSSTRAPISHPLVQTPPLFQSRLFSRQQFRQPCPPHKRRTPRHHLPAIMIPRVRTGLAYGKLCYGFRGCS